MTNDAARSERQERVMSLAAAQLPAAQQPFFGTLASEVLARLDADDLAARSDDALLAALASLLQAGSRRPPGQAQLRLAPDACGAAAAALRHTVVEVINDDMPFLVDSTTMELNRQGLSLHLIAHPVLAVQRNAAGDLLGLHSRHAAPPGAVLESWMRIEVDRVIGEGAERELAGGIAGVLAEVRAAVRDWQAMRSRLHTARDELLARAAVLPEDALNESAAFLQWLAQDHFTLLGYLQHDLVAHGSDAQLHVVPGSPLGVLGLSPPGRPKGEYRSAQHEGTPLSAQQEAPSTSFAELPARARAEARSMLPLLLLTRSNTRSKVHRPGYTDYLGVKRFDAAGQVIGEHRFIGLFTSSAYRSRVDETPLLRGKARAIAQRAGFAPGGHLAKALVHVLETYPRDDLFQISDDDLYDTVLGILALGERQRLRLFTWRDPYERFVSCLVYVPREAYSTALRVKFQALLLAAYGGTHADFDVSLGDALLARVHFNIRVPAGQAVQVDPRALEQALAGAARRWEDGLREALLPALGEGRGLGLYKQWAAALPGDYRERNSAAQAVADVLKLAALSPAQPLAAALLLDGSAAPTAPLRFKVYRQGPALALSDSLPMLERLGARVLGEHHHRIEVAGGDEVWLHDFELLAQVSDELDPARLAPLFEQAFVRAAGGEIENDDLNRLVLLAGLASEDIVVLRAYTRYCRQIGFALSQASIEAALAAHPRIARMLVGLFKLRFDPAAHDEQGAASQARAVNQALERVANLNEDRVLRQLLALVLATLRTNFWRTGVGHSGAAGPRRAQLSLKFDSAAVPGLPAPKPWVEIFVYATRFEGIHLRGGKVARGGLRWSDRPEDFRTEVLGLVKAQMVKNTVIVPVGSKGGFVLKKAPPPSEREAHLKEGVACYQDYLRALLDLTDNLAGAGVVQAPPHVVRHDGDDPYLVVAADKGTATFSDHANAISAEYGHWLGDAFASGGSAGYDHKAMGITARGAWESIKRHFRELGRDIQREPFSVVGIGDMSGDVFGNGMLMSRHTRLLAAFDHRHIFIDPEPDAAAAFTERERLFKLPRSSWAEYTSTLISAGGGVWSRSEKSVPLSPQARAVLGIEADRLTPTELISALLKAPVDLLYNGGIGTYVKARSESQADAGDRANDALRINGHELRCKVLGEGGNLGLTQRARIEAAQQGVRLYTDAIDNSAGVDTSDHEVNIKILLGLAVAAGELSLEQRNAVLTAMTDDVAALVLRDNYFQTQALSMAARQGVSLLERQARFMRHLERSGQLDRAIEYLPADDEIATRKAAGQGLTTPELAVLLAYSKMWLYDELIASALPEEPWVARTLERYFPALLRERFGKWVPQHPLKREIIVTHVVNSMQNRVGATFVHRLSETTGEPPARITHAYLAAREVFGYVPLWQEIDALDNLVPDAVQAELIGALGGLGQRATMWFLRGKRLAQPLDELISRFEPVVALLRSGTPASSAAPPARALRWQHHGVPAGLAAQIDRADELFAALDIAEAAVAAGCAAVLAAEVFSGLNDHLPLARLQGSIAALAGEGHWPVQAKLALSDDLAAAQRGLAQRVLALGSGTAAQRLAEWAQGQAGELQRARRLLDELTNAPSPDLAMLGLAVREVRGLV